MSMISEMRAARARRRGGVPEEVLSGQRVINEANTIIHKARSITEAVKTDFAPSGDLIVDTVSGVNTQPVSAKRSK